MKGMFLCEVWGCFFKQQNTNKNYFIHYHLYVTILLILRTINLLIYMRFSSFHLKMKILEGIADFSYFNDI